MSHESTALGREFRFGLTLLLLFTAILVPGDFQLLGLAWLVLACVALRWIWQSWRPAGFLILTPVALMLLSGILSWFSLRPARHGYGLPGQGFYNLDPETRTYQATRGCIIDPGAEWSILPHNLGLQGMCWLFGKPPRTYAGIYPSKEEAEQWTRDAPRVPFKDFMSGMIPVGQERLNIHADQSRAMLRTLGLGAFPFDDEEEELLVRVHAPSPDCLVIRLTCSSQVSYGGERVDAAFLLDRARTWPFALYNLVPETSLHRHPYFISKYDVSELIEVPTPKVTGPLY